jgi:hypothetical protein
VFSPVEASPSAVRASATSKPVEKPPSGLNGCTRSSSTAFAWPRALTMAAMSRVISQKLALAQSLNATAGAYRRITAVERRREVMTRYADWLNDVRGKVLAFPTAKTV